MQINMINNYKLYFKVAPLKHKIPKYCSMENLMCNMMCLIVNVPNILLDKEMWHTQETVFFYIFKCIFLNENV